MRLKTSALKIAAFVSLIMAISGSVYAQANGQTEASFDSNGGWINGVSEAWRFSESISKEDIAAAQSRWSALEQEDAPAGANQWAGTYFIGGSTHGSYLRWSPRGGFVIFNVNKCMASVMSLTYGRVEASADVIEMIRENTVTKSEDHGHGHRTQASLTFLPVTWGRSKHLVTKTRIAEFGDYVAGLGDYNDPNARLFEDSAFYTQIETRHAHATNESSSSDDQDALAVEPIVPPGYERFIKKPVNATIVSRARGYLAADADNPWWDEFIIPVTINAGSAEGVKKKMILRIVGRESMDKVVTITKANLHNSTGVIKQSVRKKPCVKYAEDDDCKDPDYEPLSIGLKVTTNPFE